MRTKLSVEDLRLRLKIRLAVAPRHLLNILWAPKSRPHETDKARDDLVAFVTHGWDSLEIEATGPEIQSGHVPYSALHSSQVTPDDDDEMVAIPRLDMSQPYTDS